jgi:hypothetical protein
MPSSSRPMGAGSVPSGRGRHCDGARGDGVGSGGRDRALSATPASLRGSDLRPLRRGVQWRSEAADPCRSRAELRPAAAGRLWSEETSAEPQARRGRATAAAPPCRTERRSGRSGKFTFGWAALSRRLGPLWEPGTANGPAATPASLAARGEAATPGSRLL